MNLILHLLIIISLASWNVFASEFGTISGKVVDARTSEPISNASVTVLGTHLGDVSNFAGEFSIAAVPVGRHTVRVSIIGYSPRDLEVEIGPATTVQFSIEQTECVPLEEIIVTENRVHLYPQTDLFVSDVEHKRPKDVGEFLRTVPGISSIRKGGTAMDPVVRGFRQDQVNVQVDGGTKICGACPNRMDPPTSHIQSEDLAKIEILKGPFTVRFGPTFGAIVNLVMEKPEKFDEPGIRGRFDGGYESNWNGKRMRGTLTGGTSKFDGYLSGGIKNFGGYRAGDDSRVQSGFRMKDYSLKLGFNPSDDERLQFTNRGSYMRDVYYPALPMDALYDDTHIYALDYAKQSVGDVLSSISAKGYASSVTHSMGNQWKPTYATMHAVTDVESRMIGGRAEAVIAPASNVFLYTGLDGSDVMKSGDRTRAFVSGPNKGKTFLDTVWQDSHITTIGGYLEGRAFVSAPLTLIGGIRLDHVSVRSDRPNSYFRSAFADFLRASENNVSAVGAMLYTVSPFVALRFGLGHGTRTADITERFVYIQPIGMDRYDYIGNPALKPEHNTQVELTSNARIGKVSMQASVYYSYLSNYISARVDASVKKVSSDVLGVKRFVNVSRAEMTGFETSVTLPLVPAVRSTVTLAYTHGQNKDINEPLPEMPPFTAAVLMQYQPGEDREWVELEGRFVARQSRISSSFLESATPGFGVISLRGGMRLMEHLSLGAAITNLFDKAYYEHLNRLNKADGHPLLEPGRAFTMNVQFVY